eukprot:COSAG06_NODE_66996_length_253_cov_0.649351_1_plen_23_part_10
MARFTTMETAVGNAAVEQGQDLK